MTTPVVIQPATRQNGDSSMIILPAYVTFSLKHDGLKYLDIFGKNEQTGYVKQHNFLTHWGQGI